MSLVTSLKTKVDLDSRFNHNQYNGSALKSNRKILLLQWLSNLFYCDSKYEIPYVTDTLKHIQTNITKTYFYLALL